MELPHFYVDVVRLPDFIACLAAGLYPKVVGSAYCRGNGSGYVSVLHFTNSLDSTDILDRLKCARRASMYT